MIPIFIVQVITICMGVLYPAYASFKAVRDKDVREYVRWMMYWIVWAFYSTIEYVTDIFLGCWLPFYWEFKILMVLWLVSPFTCGATILYRKLVHPQLMARECEIDEFIELCKEKGYYAIVKYGSAAINYLVKFVMQATSKKGSGEGDCNKKATKAPSKKLINSKCKEEDMPDCTIGPSDEEFVETECDDDTTAVCSEDEVTDIEADPPYCDAAPKGPTKPKNCDKGKKSYAHARSGYMMKRSAYNNEDDESDMDTVTTRSRSRRAVVTSMEDCSRRPASDNFEEYYATLPKITKQSRKSKTHKSMSNVHNVN